MSEVEVIPNEAMYRYQSPAERSGRVATAAITGPTTAMTAGSSQARPSSAPWAVRPNEPPVGSGGGEVSQPCRARVAVLA